MTRIISPMYGNDIPEPKPVEEIPAYKPKTTHRKAAPSRDDSTVKPSEDLRAMMEKEPVGPKAETVTKNNVPEQGTLLEKDEK